MAIFRPPSPLVQSWLMWLDGHCSVKGHVTHLRYQCIKSSGIALCGVIGFHSPHEPIRHEPLPAVAVAWLKWLFRPCTVLGHNVHLRNLCRESREQCLREAVMEAYPEDED